MSTVLLKPGNLGTIVQNHEVVFTVAQFTSNLVEHLSRWTHASHSILSILSDDPYEFPANQLGECVAKLLTTHWPTRGFFIGLDWGVGLSAIPLFSGPTLLGSTQWIFWESLSVPDLLSCSRYTFCPLPLRLISFLTSANLRLNVAGLCSLNKSLSSLVMVFTEG